MTDLPRPLPGQKKLGLDIDLDLCVGCHASATAHALGLEDDDWVYVSSHSGRIEAQIKLMDGVNPNTVWTWNAIGKRSGAWNLAPDSPEFTRGFLLNHLISDLLPASRDGAADGLANADPITGQAAWYDLRVRVERAPAAEAGHSAPRFTTLSRPPSLPQAPEILRYGGQFAGPEGGDSQQGREA